MGALSAAVSLRGCWPWQLAMGLLYYSLVRLRVLDVVRARPVRGDRGYMIRYCDEVLAQASSAELQDASLRQAWQLQMLKEGAPRHALAAMQQFPNDAALHTACVSSLCSVALFNAGAEEALLELGAMRSVLVSGLGFVHDPDVTSVAAATLGCLADEYMGARVSLMKMGGPQFAVDTWDRYPDQPHVLFGACALVAGMCYDNPGAKFRMVEVGFVQRGLQGIRDFPNSGDRIREEVMQAFNALSGRPVVQKVQEYMMEVGVLEGVLTVLHENNDDMTTLTNANRVVQNFAVLNKSYRVAMAEAGVLELLAGQLGTFDPFKAWAPYVDVDLTAVIALNQLATGDRSEDDTKRRMLRAGVPEKVQEAMKKRPQHEHLVNVGTELMNRLKSVEGQN